MSELWKRFGKSIRKLMLRSSKDRLSFTEILTTGNTEELDPRLQERWRQPGGAGEDIRSGNLIEQLKRQRDTSRPARLLPLRGNQGPSSTGKLTSTFATLMKDGSKPGRLLNWGGRPMPEGNKGRRRRSAAREVMLKIRILAIEALGSEEAADVWLSEPAIALNGQRPVDARFKKLVEDLLGRIELGVYT